MKTPLLIKVGGSLLDWPPLKEHLGKLLAGVASRRCVLLAGGGRLADAVRHYDDLWNLSDDDTHWMAIATMRTTARVLSHLSGLPLTEDFPENTAPAVLDPWRLLRDSEPHAPGPPLPHSWEVTSDSIAARLARLWAAELWLVKRGGPHSTDAEELAAAGVVDEQFPRQAAGLVWRLSRVAGAETRP